jgi:hypothetical protein
MSALRSSSASTHGLGTGPPQPHAGARRPGSLAVAALRPRPAHRAAPAARCPPVDAVVRTTVVSAEEVLCR